MGSKQITDGADSDHQKLKQGQEAGRYGAFMILLHVHAGCLHGFLEPESDRTEPLAHQSR